MGLIYEWEIMANIILNTLDAAGWSGEVGQLENCVLSLNRIH